MFLIECLDTSYDTFAFTLLQPSFNENIVKWMSFHSMFDLKKIISSS